MADKLTALELKLKKVALAGKKYTDDQIDASSVNLFTKTAANDGFLKTYILSTAKSLAEATTDNTIGEIDIPKDFLVKSGSVITVVDVDGTLKVGEDAAPAGITAAGKYLDFVLNTKGDSEKEEDAHIYISVADIVDIYTSGNGINVGDDNVISIKLNATASGLEVDADGLKIKVAATGANGLSIDGDGLKLALAQASTNGEGGAAGAMSASDKETVDKALTTDDYAELSDKEIGSWYGYNAEDSATILGGVTDAVAE